MTIENIENVVRNVAFPVIFTPIPSSTIYMVETDIDGIRTTVCFIAQNRDSYVVFDPSNGVLYKSDEEEVIGIIIVGKIVDRLFEIYMKRGIVEEVKAEEKKRGRKRGRKKESEKKEGISEEIEKEPEKKEEEEEEEVSEKAYEMQQTVEIDDIVEWT